MTAPLANFETATHPAAMWDRCKSLAWLLCLIGMLLPASGCSQFVLISYLLHGPPSIEPDFDAETGESMSAPKKVVAVVCFAPTEIQWKFPRIDDDVARHLSYRLAQNHIKVIEPDYIRAYCDEHPNWEKASEIGKYFHADYVIEVELAAFSLYEGNSTTLYRGRTEAYVHVVKMEENYEDGERIFTKELEFSFPTKVPRSSYDQALPAFQKEYLSRLSDRLGFLFYERYTGDMIPWAN